ncbi:hypothetical protein N7474_001408 [Penicillium riverlandense]|uniref:uncharacterized protein n=1 Tax=Penicillium riverlandense TaxID=1903569 RepID=UPI00254962FB|nr:uncharacterized protein N7474_001408 [Penicillium riverlandense]KAJ5833097.1 hypothetical protein N7474_001408 [Penicillium riverlandense]
MSTPNDLQALLASIRPRPSPTNAAGQDTSQPQRPSQYQHPGMFPPHPQQQQPYDGQSFAYPQPHGYHHPSVSSNIQSPAPVNTPPHHGSDILSPNVPTPRNEWPPQQPQQAQPDRAANLLNLLKFKQVASPAAQPQVPIEQPPSLPGQEAASPHERNISASDFVASLFGKQAAPAAAPPVQPSQSAANAAGPSENTQEMLLRLLNRHQPVGLDGEESPALAEALRPQETKETLMEVMESTPVEPAKPEKVASPPSKESLFTYVNPFDQLAAVSPRNKSPQPKHTPETQPKVSQTKRQKINPESTPVLEIKTGASPPVLDEAQQQAVNDVVGRLVDQIGRSLSGSEPKPTAKASIPTDPEQSTQGVLSSVASHLRETAGEAKQAAAEPATDATAAPAGQDANQNAEALADSWESAEDSAEKEEERVISVHNFPLRPFITIAVKSQSGKLPTFRDDGVMDIARLKKEFDQLDRSLTAATSEYIVYALAKTGGIRIIRQDDGSDRQVFRSTRDRIFNVALCTSPSATGASEVQAILGIGVSGAVYWALISHYDKDLFDLDALESESLIFPPFPASDENTSGGQLKTRAKRSTRHPDLFAIGRGKNIYVVSPRAAMNSEYGVTGSQRTVNTEKFLKERALKISTGKAGKDFAFSDDDTIIASLDKTGRLRFWDISDVLDDPNFIDGVVSNLNEVRVPLNTFVTGSPAEKSWPTSVLFIDKLRAYSKNMALRYVLVGLKQNHTLQLWDIGLGKAVQELKFPHENESDAICSVNYHPSSGIIVVGHPTRNSIYFVHLSAPRYNLGQMTQTAYIRAASEKDSTLPKPESTACLSGIREISLGSKGQLRSLEILPITKSSRGTEDTGLFELYVMHSRGVTCLTIKKEDLGWTSDNKVIRPVDALGEGRIEISELQSFPSYVTDDPSINGDSASTPSRATTKEPPKKVEIAESVSGATPSRNTSPTKQSKKKGGEEQPEAPSGTDKSEKKKKKKAAAEAKAKEPTATVGVETLPSEQSKNGTLASSTSTAAMNATQAADRGIQPGVVSALPSGLSADTLNKHLETLQNSVSSEFNKSLGREFEDLYRRFDDERRSWDAASSAKQDQVLRLVSSTLSDNVEQNLARIVSSSIQSDVVPAITDAATTAAGKQLNSIVSQHLGATITDELRQALPKAVTNALQQPAVIKSVSDSVAQKVAPRVEAEVSKTVQSSIAPLIQNLARSTKKAETDMENHFQAQIKRYEAQRQSDNAKIEEMSVMLRDLSNTVASLVVTQRQGQGQSPVANVKRASVAASASRPSDTNARAPPPQAASRAAPPPAAPGPVPAAALSAPPRSAEEAELTEIMQLINAGQFEEGSIKWLQSSQQADLFDNFFVRVPPSYLARLSPIMTLSVGVAVTSSLQTNISQRLSWLEVVLQTVDARDNDLREVAPRIMDILSQRLNNLYMTVAERNPHDPILRMIAPLSRRARELHDQSK